MLKRTGPNMETSRKQFFEEAVCVINLDILFTLVRIGVEKRRTIYAKAIRMQLCNE